MKIDEILENQIYKDNRVIVHSVKNSKQDPRISVFPESNNVLDSLPSLMQIGGQSLVELMEMLLLAGLTQNQLSLGIFKQNKQQLFRAYIHHLVNYKGQLAFASVIISQVKRKLTSSNKSSTLSSEDSFRVGTKSLMDVLILEKLIERHASANVTGSNSILLDSRSTYENFNSKSHELNMIGAIHYTNSVRDVRTAIIQAFDLKILAMKILQSTRNPEDPIIDLGITYSQLIDKCDGFFRLFKSLSLTGTREVARLELIHERYLALRLHRVHAALYRLRVSTTHFEVSIEERRRVGDKKEYFVLGVHGEGSELQKVSYASLNSKKVIGYEAKEIEGEDLERILPSQIA